ncbi:MAG: hypothetical protein IJA32_16035 [Lachnospiraceae bacterium]|nr:hypothetical protein [Lachnospiraceae bacterium]
MMNKIELELNINEIFCSDDKFEMIMLQAFTAREDVYTINKLLQREDLTRTEFLFLFKIIIGITREANELLREIYEKYTDNLMEFSNWGQIESHKNELERINNGIGKDSFSYQVIKKIRDQTFHYKDTHNIKNRLNECIPIESVFNIGTKTAFDTEYVFTQDIFYNYVESVWRNYRKAEDEVNSVPEFVKLMSEYSVSVAKNLEVLIDGYFDKYTNFTEDALEKHILKRK